LKTPSSYLAAIVIAACLSTSRIISWRESKVCLLGGTCG
jgi:hypothetical protein